MEKQSRDFCRVQKKKKEGVTMKRKRGLVHVILALLMSMLLIVSTGCGKSGSGDSSSDKKTDKTETLADVNTIPEDGVITKEQFKTVGAILFCLFMQIRKMGFGLAAYAVECSILRKWASNYMHCLLYTSSIRISLHTPSGK